MSQFIDLADYDATVHREILEALTRQDDAIIEICEDRAISEMKNYLARRYDVDSIFAARQTARHQLILMFGLDISIYHIFCIHNPLKLSQMRKDRYERAIEWLKQVGSVNNPLPVDDLPLKPNTDQKSLTPFLSKSQPKRTNHF